MQNPQIKLTEVGRWRSARGVHVRGDAFWRHDDNSVVNLLDAFEQVQTLAEFVATIKRLNGFFAVVRETAEGVFAAVDQMRSLPLFYGRKDGVFYLSDDAHWVRDQVGDTEFDKLAETEFELTGYVTGSETLCPNVKQVQMGEAILIRPGPSGFSVVSERHFEWRYQKPFQVDEDELLHMHESMLSRVFGRLMKWANGRCLCIPLSGGCDSRLIAVTLKQLGYPKIFAFSYGKKGNQEERFSRQVAGNLGIPWHMVPYTHESWYEWFQSPERKKFSRFAGGLTSLPHLQDWPAVWVMKKAGLLPEDAVFVPGHAGNCPTGDHLPPEALGHETPCEDLFVRAVRNRHYSLVKWDPGRDNLGEVLHRRVTSRIKGFGFDTLEQVANAVEQWEWQERQAKFITNSVRVYEFWGYQWWLPLWDLEFVDFWSKVGFHHRVGQTLYRKYVRRKYASVAGIGEDSAKKVTRQLTRPLRAWLKSTRLNPLAQAIYRRYKKRTEYDNYHLGIWGAMPKEVYRRVYTGTEDLNWFFAVEHLGRLSFERHQSP